MVVRHASKFQDGTFDMDIVLVADLYGVDDADNGGVDGAVLALERHAGRTTLHDEYDLIDAGSNGIDGDQMPFLILAFDVDHSGDQKLAPVKAIIFSRCNDGSDYSGKKHAGPLSVVRGQLLNRQ